MQEKTEFHSTCYTYMGSVLLQKMGVTRSSSWQIRHSK